MANINIQSLHFVASDKLVGYIEKKVSKLEKFSDDIIGSDVVLKVTKPETANNKEVSIKMNVKNDELFASKIAESFEEAAALCTDALEKQLIKHKEKTAANKNNQ